MSRRLSLSGAMQIGTIAAALLLAAGATPAAAQSAESGTPPEMVATYNSLADGILALKRTEENIVRSILAAGKAHGEVQLMRAQRAITANDAAGAKAAVEALAADVAQLGTEGDNSVGAVRKRLLEGGQHHNAAGEAQGIYDEGYVVVTKAAKRSCSTPRAHRADGRGAEGGRARRRMEGRRGDVRRPDEARALMRGARAVASIASARPAAPDVEPRRRLVPSRRRSARRPVSLRPARSPFRFVDVSAPGRSHARAARGPARQGSPARFRRRGRRLPRLRPRRPPRHLHVERLAARRLPRRREGQERALSRAAGRHVQGRHRRRRRRRRGRVGHGSVRRRLRRRRLAGHPRHRLRQERALPKSRERHVRATSRARSASSRQAGTRARPSSTPTATAISTSTSPPTSTHAGRRC